MSRIFGSVHGPLASLVLVTWLLGTGPVPLKAQAAPSADPAPLVIILTRAEKGDVPGAERLMRDNLPVTKRRLEETLTQFDQKFDDLGRAGATSGRDVHAEIIEKLLDEVHRYEKLFDIYRRVTGDEIPLKRLEARILRFEGAYYTTFGEDACGKDLNWAEAQKRYTTAMERLQAGFDLAKEVNDLRVMASAKNNMGSTLIRLIEPEKAIQAYEEGMRYANQLPGEMYKGLVNLNLGNTYVWIGQPETSLRFSESALASFKKMGRGTWQANAQMNIGNAYIREQKFSSAWESLRVALELAKQSGEDRVRGRALLNLGMAAFELKKPEAAALIREGLAWYAKEGVDVYPNIEREAVRQDGLLLLARIAKANGNEAEETKYHKQFLEALGPDPDRYGTLRASPCFVIYQARPTREKTSRP